jgi:hypothetical protein
MIVRQGFEPLPEHLKPLLGECYPTWEYLRRHAVQPLAAAAVPRPLGPADSEQRAHEQQQQQGSSATVSSSGGGGGGREKVGGCSPDQGPIALGRLLGAEGWAGASGRRPGGAHRLAGG